jgi:hypothetical protein
MAITKLFSGGPPIFDFHLEVAIAAGAPVSIETGTVYLMGCRIINTDAANPLDGTLVDTSGFEIAEAAGIPPKQTAVPPDINLMPVVGIKAGASGVGLKLRIWGYRGASS